MCHAFGPTARHVFAGSLETFARAGESRTASTPPSWPLARNAARRQTAQTSGAMGRRLAEIRGRLARSTRCLFGKDKSSGGEERKNLDHVPDLPRKSGLACCGRELE